MNKTKKRWTEKMKRNKKLLYLYKINSKFQMRKNKKTCEWFIDDFIIIFMNCECDEKG